MSASYLSLFKSGALHKRAAKLKKRLENCDLCPRGCHVNRLAGQEGFCHGRTLPMLASATAHFGEEPILVGDKGSGTLFFGSCNLRCLFCQNWQISHLPQGEHPGECPVEELAEKMVELQNLGCHNINLVSPSHFIAQILEALVLACQKGLKIPLVYNSNAYDDLETLKVLRGIIDIYLPDLKYADHKIALKYSQAFHYPEIARLAVKEMYDQVGLLKLDKKGVAKKGLIIRHLVLPNTLAGTEETLRWIVKELSPKVTLSIMSQYYPAHKASKVPLLSRPLRDNEYWEVVELLEELELENGYLQGFESQEVYRPNFDAIDPFIDSKNT